MRCRQGPGADETLGFPDEAREGLFRGRELVVVAQRVEYGGVGFGSDLVLLGEDRFDLDCVFRLQGAELGDERVRGTYEPIRKKVQHWEQERELLDPGTL